MVPIFTLFISTYSSMIISLARHFKIEEKEGNIGNLRDRFAELISRIKHQIDVLKPWKHEDYYLNDTNNDKEHEWTSLLKRVDKEYNHIVDIRKELYVNFSKLVNKAVFERYHKDDIEEINVYEDKDEECEDNNRPRQPGQIPNPRRQIPRDSVRAPQSEIADT